MCTAIHLCLRVVKTRMADAQAHMNLGCSRMHSVTNSFLKNFEAHESVILIGSIQSYIEK